MDGNDGPIESFEGKYGFLSNFYDASAKLDGVLFPTAEHAFQAAKTSDPKERKDIRGAGTPTKAKRMGKRVRLRKDWEKVKIGIMEALVRDKFTRHPELAEGLVATGERQLIEGNTWNDTFWGVCDGRGHNHLGKILMRVRGELRG